MNSTITTPPTERPLSSAEAAFAAVTIMVPSVADLCRDYAPAEIRERLRRWSKRLNLLDQK